MSREELGAKISFLLLRAGLAFSFAYAALRAEFDPNSWIGYFPPFLLHTVPEDVLLIVWGLFELVIAIWILSGRHIFIPCLLASISLIGLVIFNFSQIDILFRDVSLALVSLALAIATYRR